MNRQADKRIEELERIVIVAKECVRITQELNDKKNERIKELEAENDKIRRCRCCEAKEQIAGLQAELEQHRWIPVSERLPEQVSGHWGSKKVFATDGKQAWACKYNYSAEYWTAPSGDITHWKPIILP